MGVRTVSPSAEVAVRTRNVPCLCGTDEVSEPPRGEAQQPKSANLSFSHTVGNLRSSCALGEDSLVSGVLCCVVLRLPWRSTTLEALTVPQDHERGSPCAHRCTTPAWHRLYLPVR